MHPDKRRLRAKSKSKAIALRRQGVPMRRRKLMTAKGLRANLHDLDHKNLYRKEEFLDRKSGGIDVYTPVNIETGEVDTERPQLCIGWTIFPKIGRVEFELPTSDPREALDIWIIQLNHAVDAMEAQALRQSIANPGSINGAKM